jgi:hypothetical protein
LLIIIFSSRGILITCSGSATPDYLLIEKQGPSRENLIVEEFAAWTETSVNGAVIAGSELMREAPK